MQSGRIVVTGASGFLGRHLLPILCERYGADRVRGLSSRDYDLMDRAQVDRMMRVEQPDVLVHLAAYSGGIGVNRAKPADFYYRNTLLVAHAFQAAAEFGVRKLIYTMGGCSYPATATSPIDESQMWMGYPQVDSIGYSAAKKMGIVASETYARQYGLQSVVLIPGNMYGPHDNFREAESHVIPAMIRRLVEAKRAGLNEVVMWGSGSPTRDFVYAGDVAATFPFFIESYVSSEPVNISSGTTTSIRHLAEMVRELVGYTGRLQWDTSKPEGQMIKIFGVDRQHSLGLRCPTSLEQGLEKTIDWFTANYLALGDGIRV